MLRYLGHPIEKAQVAGSVFNDDLRRALVEPVVDAVIRRKAARKPAGQDVEKRVHDFAIFLAVGA